MKKLLILPLLFILTGCPTVPVKQEFPKVPDSFLVPAPQLKVTPDGASASEVFDVVIENYSTYHSVSNTLSKWQEWYKQQKQLSE
jgi:hypothetical protein